MFESFTSCSGARKGKVYTAVKRADSRYLTQRLIGTTQELFVKGYSRGTNYFYYHTQYIKNAPM